jgi:hypothetical protein
VGSTSGYIGKHPRPGFASLAPDKVEATITPGLLFTAHSSLLDLVSWNRSIPTGCGSCACRPRTASALNI